MFIFLDVLYSNEFVCQPYIGVGIITGVWYDSNIFLTAILSAFLYGRNKRVFDR